ncbi:MAG: DUF2283 domain-containing protein [SAR202 cluster bacterium]|nr:DUF2283 domain-containing protein [SAR202 cluster bacterium]
MKSIKYSKDADAALIELSHAAIDHAKESGPFIIHFSKNRTPVLLEILNFSEILEQLELAVYGKSIAKVLEINEQRIRELAALNKLFQQYLEERFTGQVGKLFGEISEYLAREQIRLH